ncbi:MAG TPA: endonuclease/exonuclease/phosphatase family protein [Candidatus Acidoferrales bacterium]|nr:endonuclease/exonuclease/phosphatase family protein [Candidatus Acidoferrales bacterium]
MKLMSYNILDGGVDRLPLIIDAIKKEAPDYLTINEANTFAQDDNKILKELTQQIDLPYFDVALSEEYDYHVAAFSKYPFKHTTKPHPLTRACLITLIDTDLGELSVASLHLTPYAEDLRHPEIDLIIKAQKQYENRILMGDMNSLSQSDNYDSQIIQQFTVAQLKKFTTDTQIRFDAINKILSVGYYDVAKELEKNKENTVPTPTSKDTSHSQMRLDYIFISDSLLPHLKDYSVVKNKITDKASDHYPIIAELK